MIFPEGGHLMRLGRRIVDGSCSRTTLALHHHQALAMLEGRDHQLEWKRETGGSLATRNDNKVYIGSFNIVIPPSPNAFGILNCFTTPRPNPRHSFWIPVQARTPPPSLGIPRCHQWYGMDISWNHPMLITAGYRQMNTGANGLKRKQN